MNVEIIAVGTEILHGDIANTNAQFISKKMEEIGIDVLYHSVVGDNKNRIKEAFSNAIERVDIIISTGGLGPTQDDITKESVAELLNLDMYFCADSFKKINNYFNSKCVDMPENNLKQAYFPKGSEIIRNDNGTADACKIIYNGKIIYLLPGVPSETYSLINKFVIDDLKSMTNFVLYHKMIQVYNMGESQSEILLMDIISSQSNPTIASYADEKKLVYRITAKANSIDEAKNMVDKMVLRVLDILGNNAKVLE